VESNLLKDLQPQNGRFGAQHHLTQQGSGDLTSFSNHGRSASTTTAVGSNRQQQQQLAVADRQALMKQEDRIAVCQAKVRLKDLSKLKLLVHLLVNFFD
jgi:hypothetical protein